MPTSIVHFFRREIFPAVRGIYSTLPGKNLVFCLCMIPTVSPLQKHGEEHRREATINISASAATIGSDDLPRRHLSSGVDALRTVAPSRPRQPSPPTAPLPASPQPPRDIDKNHRRRLRSSTANADVHLFYTSPPTLLSNPFLLSIVKSCKEGGGEAEYYLGLEQRTRQRPTQPWPNFCARVRETTRTRTLSVGHQQRRAALQATINRRMTAMMEGRASEARRDEEDGGGTRDR